MSGVQGEHGFGDAGDSASSEVELELQRRSRRLFAGIADGAIWATGYRAFTSRQAKRPVLDAAPDVFAQRLAARSGATKLHVPFAHRRTRFDSLVRPQRPCSPPWA